MIARRELEQLPAPLDEATELLLTRDPLAPAATCAHVGLGYLTLDRQSRTLSGGEVQRINLTTALGTSLVNTLFVLDEPSIGLHPRDMGRVIDVMKRLRDAGNSLVVVEHDPQIMLAADKLLDMGPGPGERGGEIVFFGSPDELKGATTLTADYLSGRKRADTPLGEARARREVPNDLARIRWRRGDRSASAAPQSTTSRTSTSTIPLHRLVCVTGVSGSGKSTLVQDVLHAALRKPRASPRRRRARIRELAAHEHVNDIVLVDQSPIGRTTRSNPASYVGAFDAIRKLFARAPDSRGARLHAGHVQLQRRQRALPHLRRQRLRARRDAVPLRRLPALPRLRRQALSRRGARGEGRRPHHRRRARDHRLRSAARSSPRHRDRSAACSRSPTWASTTCASASPCRRFRAARRSA